MRLLTALFILLPLCAQEQPTKEPAKPAPADQNPPTAPATPTAPAASTPAAQSAPATPAPTEQPASTGDGWYTGSIEIGYRWIPNIGGSFDTYRSAVNLGEGPKLLNADFTLRDPSHKFFDTADVHAASFGDPYNTLRVDIQKDKWYRLLLDYRNTAYFNFLPSFADPLLSTGQLLNENSFDTRIRSTSVELDLLPRNWIQPYVAFDRNTQFGRGITAFETDQDTFPVASLYSDQTNTYRAGVRINLAKYHFTLEQGGTTFKEDDGASENQKTLGNVLNTFLGQQLSLSNVNELYRVRGDSYYTKALIAANPVSWATISGEFIFSQPRTNVTYTSNDTGNLFLSSLFQFYSAGQDVLTADANMPHTTGNFNIEIRPLPRLRILETYTTDRYHNASAALLSESFLIAGANVSDSQLANDRLVLNDNQEEIQVFYDLTSRLTVHGGYRYEWGDAEVRASALTETPFENAHLRRNIGLGGFTWRVLPKLRISGDAEGTSSDQAFFRTSLLDYQKARIRGNYDISRDWKLSASFSLLNNSNPDPGTKLDFSTRIGSVSLLWLPKGGKKINVLLDYTRSAVRSDILAIVPQILALEPSLYSENAHTGTALIGYRWLSFGGSFFISSGSRPTQYYQPLARLAVPLHKHIQWIAEWKWYSLAETFYSYENFRSNQFTTSLRFFK